MMPGGELPRHARPAICRKSKAGFTRKEAPAPGGWVAVLPRSRPARCQSSHTVVAELELQDDAGAVTGGGAPGIWGAAAQALVLARTMAQVPAPGRTATREREQRRGHGLDDRRAPIDLNEGQLARSNAIHAGSSSP